MQMTDDMINNNLNTAVSNYSRLINYYAQQKENFLKLYSQAAKKEIPNTVALFYNTVFKDLKKFDNQQANEYTSKIYSEFQEALLSQLSKENLNKLRSLGDKLKQDKENKQEQSQKLLKDMAEQIFNSEKIEQLIKDFLYKNFSFLNNKNFNNPKQFLDYLISYRNNIFYRFATDEKFSAKNIYVSQNYREGMKGYIQEAAVADAFNKLANKLSNSEIDIEVKTIGSENTPIDISIDFKIPEHLSVTGTAEVQTFGIQSKSWIVPWDKDFKANNNTSMDLGNKQKLFNNFMSNSNLLKHSWSYSVLWLSQFENAKEATDNAVLWNTGHQLFWTDSLIQQQIKNGRYIAFPWSKQDYAPSNARLKWNTIKAMNYNRENE